MWSPHAIVEEADNLEAQLAVLEDLVGDDPPEVAGAGDQHALQADARAPAAFEGFAHELARGVREGHVQDQEEQPDPLRDFVEADVLVRLGGVVGLVVERAAEAEDHREDVPTKTPKKSSTRERPRRRR